LHSELEGAAARSDSWLGDVQPFLLGKHLGSHRGNHSRTHSNSNKRLRQFSPCVTFSFFFQESVTVKALTTIATLATDMYAHYRTTFSTSDLKRYKKQKEKKQTKKGREEC
jgi:hypothetical protein